ncbi:MAG TPA: nuclear transport factor 2 family protein [Usitatibacter sp.]|jgi:ketosteroid isomerase-like protein|nr:nuclear transport factor 2 family protein [Usitatibacter sp.]
MSPSQMREASKRPWVHASIVAVLAACAQVPSAPPPATASSMAVQPAAASPEAAIDAQEARFTAALANRDVPSLERLVAESFTWQHPEGRVDSREAFLAGVVHGVAHEGRHDLRQEYGPSLALNGASATRTARVRLRDRAGTHETWLREDHAFTRTAGGEWRLASARNAILYEGAPLSDSLHSRYGGSFAVEPGRVLRLVWSGGILVATFPDGSSRQVFLVSPTEEAVRDPQAGHLRFTLSDDGRPATVALVRNGQEIWRATRSQPEMMSGTSAR